ncbi:LacI family DNA-binding transcriptional regulator [Cytobacillus firmus]|nr:LacI family DNA-binding transcriptional regulator [Cytobacillus firmus]
MTRSSNLIEVAKAAGVSNMTVSRVINNSGSVSEKTGRKY